jgi:hypothetical protein
MGRMDWYLLLRYDSFTFKIYLRSRVSAGMNPCRIFLEKSIFFMRMGLSMHFQQMLLQAWLLLETIGNL